MKKIKIHFVLIVFMVFGVPFLFGACASLPSVEIELEGAGTYKRTGVENIGEMKIEYTPDGGLKVEVTDLSNSEAEKFNEAMFTFLKSIAPLISLVPGLPVGGSP